MEAQRALEIQLLGGFRVTVGHAVIPDTAWRRKRAAAVIKLLALEPGHRLHPEQLIDALWPDLDPDAAANNLRVALHHARQRLHMAGAAPDAFLGRVGEVISLGSPEDIQVDVDRFDAAAQRAWQTADPDIAESALAWYGGDLLPEDLYEDWAADRRVTLRASYLSLLRRLAQLHEERGELDRAILALHRLIASEPLDEDAQAALIRLLALTGRQRQALQHYDHLVALLHRDLDAEPRAETRELIAAIRDGSLAASAPLAAAVAAPADMATRPRGLPFPVDELVGREREVAELRRLLTTSRLVTLTGPGGVGKTRLAFAAAHAAAGTFPDGVYAADLASLEDAALVLPAVARAVGAGEVAGQDLFDTMIDQLGGRRALLVIDNMEHVAAAAPDIAALLAACGRLAVLITSRSRLKLQGEQEYAVQPLALPEPAPDAGRSRDALPSMALAEAPAVALFVRRARAARPEFVLTGTDATAVAEICRRVDGLPLAIELAAARVRLLTPAELLARLEHPLAVLTDGPRDAPARQRTLRAAIAWSHDLLSPVEQDLFARLSVFAGGCTVEAAERVAGWQDRGVAGGSTSDVPVTQPPSHSAALDLLASLVDHSLLRQMAGPDGSSRLSMLATIRDYARERLEFRGEADAVRQRHAAYFLALAESAALDLEGPEQASWLERLETEHDNLRQALTTCDETGDHRNLLRLAAALWRFWWQRGFFREGRQWLEQALAVGDDAAAATRATARDGAGALAEAQGDLAAAAIHHEAALALRRQIGDRRGEVRSLVDFGIIADKLGDAARAIQLFEEGLAIAREDGDRPRLAASLANLGFVLLDQGDHHRAVAVFKESLELFRDLGDERNLSYVLGGLGTLAFLQGDFAGAVAMQEAALRALRALGDRQGIADTLADLGHAVQRQGELDHAGELYTEALQQYRELGDASGAAFVLTHLGRLSNQRGDNARAEALLREGLRVGWEIGEKPIQTEAVEGLAEVACDRGEALLCARLLGAADALRETTGIPLPAVHEPAIAHCVTTARAVLGETGFTAARAEGRALAPDQALAALAAPDAR